MLRVADKLSVKVWVRDRSREVCGGEVRGLGRGVVGSGAAVDEAGAVGELGGGQGLVGEGEAEPPRD